MAKVFLIGCSDAVWADLARRLHKDAGWEIAYWTTTSEYIARLSPQFPSTVFHDVIRATKSLPPESPVDITPMPVGCALLDALSASESISLQMMNRIGVGADFTYEERKELYLRYLAFWSGALSRFQPNLVVFPESPHAVYDHVLYQLCLRESVPTFMFDLCAAYPHLIFPQRIFEEGLPQVRARYRKLLAAGQTAKLSAHAKEYLSKTRAPYALGSPQHIIDYSSQAEQAKAAVGWKSILSYAFFPWRLAGPIRKAWTYWRAPAKAFYWPKKAGSPLWDSELSRREWQAKRRHRRRILRGLAAYYRSLAQRPPLDRPFIFVALHFQPERTTSPMGGHFVDQHLMLELLSACRPKGWWLYVKEAPSFFWPQVAKIPQRSRRYYDRINSLPDTALLYETIDPFTLIDSARAVATVTGTSAFESAVRGTPALCFGSPWYLGCEGVFKVRCADDCRGALEKVAGGFTPDPAKVALFNQAVEECGVNAYARENFAHKFDISPQENLDRLFRLLRREIPR